MKIKLWACGGLGGNVGHDFYKAQKSPGFSEIDVCFIDTSLSNLRDKKIEAKDVYVLEGLDGSGSLRKENAQQIQESIKTAVHKFQPAEFNIVVFSLSGGSGSVLGPSILKELLSKNKTAVAIIVGSEESRIKIDNTVKSLQTLDAISRKVVNKPLVISYHHNDKEHSRVDNDHEIKKTITALSVLNSGENAELDTADINHFIHVDKVTSVKEGLVSLYITNDSQCNVEFPISTVSLFSKREDYQDFGTPEYSCHGYPTEDVLKGSNLFYVTSQSEINRLFNKLKKRLDEFEETSSARIQSEALGGSADESGFVF